MTTIGLDGARSIARSTIKQAKVKCHFGFFLVPSLAQHHNIQGTITPWWITKLAEKTKGTLSVAATCCESWQQTYTYTHTHTHTLAHKHKHRKHHVVFVGGRRT